MPVTEEQIVIEFVAEYSSLSGAVDTIKKGGTEMAQLAVPFKQTSQALNESQKSFQKFAQGIKGPLTSLDQLDAKSKNFIKNFIQGFEEGVKAELLSAKKEIDALKAKLEKGLDPKPARNLKQELKALNIEIATAIAKGGPVSQAMIDQAGELKDAIADANQVIKSAGSDTRNLDALLGSVQAVAGGFAIAQGAVAVFGDESEDLQKTLTKVNGAMSILQGLQSVTNALLKEGAIGQLAVNTQQAIANTQTTLNTAATSANIVVKYAAIAAQKALNLVLSLNPYAVIISAILVLITQMDNWAAETRDAARANAELDDALRKTNEQLGDQADFINDIVEKQVIAAERAGKDQLHILALQRTGIEENMRARQEQFDANQKIIDAENGDEKKRAELIKSNAELEKQIRKDDIALQKNAAAIGKQQQKDLDDARNKFLDEEEKRLAKQKQNAADKKRDDAEAAALFAANLKNEIAGKQELILLNEVQGKSTRVLQLEIINLQAQYDSLGKSAEEASLIQTKAMLETQKVLVSTFKEPLEESKASLIDTSKAVENFATGSLTVIETQVEETKQTFQEFLAEIIPDIQDGLNAIGTVGDKVNQVAQEAENNTQQAIENDKNRVESLLKAGSITEKEAKARRDRIESQEKQLRIRQAKREKDAAIFAGLINVAQAVTKAFTAGPVIGQVLAGVVAALGAAQVALIASRPLPSFFRGKNNRWEGLGRYGEAGSEMRINKDGTMEYATKPTVSYIGPDDIILNPYQTQKFVNERPLKGVDRVKKEFAIDYDRLGSVVGKGAIVSINIEKDFIREEVAAGLLKTNWLGKRYSFKR